MPKHQLRPAGSFPAAGLIRRFAAIFYDTLLCLALAMSITLAYQQGLLRAIYGNAQLKAMADAGALDADPLLASLVFLGVFAFFAKFWTHNGQTLGMQVWRIRVQNKDGSAISLWQALVRFMAAIASWVCLGLGFFWVLVSKEKRSWHDSFSDSELVQLPKDTHKK
ncbi:RDD family protein [Pseudomonas sp. N040]|uniref:RDD family protein n=1 Tax=Pseudomonas sp. N040 TaxID=2785325 RepID=UPI0018A2F315|nr:RDD family protein [Pseudomonas sp. N040]MBF7731102.1 RDD family protein [Pseudomonas sp. N040]MBW7014745.1 RDD family protein [Pseudomonas sp. N040]